MTVKIIATSKSALFRKYQLAGALQVWGALQTLVAADLVRGISTTIIDIDTGRPITSRLTPPGRAGWPSETATKAAINAILKKYNPAYLMLLGGPDVVRHQTLNNPMLGDGDANVPSDLPYASQSAYSKDITKHLGVTHVVGRLPDLLNATSPAFLVKLIKYAATARTIPAASYKGAYGVSAEVWQNSTQMSMTAIFGSGVSPRLSPPITPPVSAALLRSRSHFINCHGDTSDFHFYGQRGTSYPTAMETPDNVGRITRGCVASVECCFGAEIYDPTPIGEMGLCCCYLADGAHGFFGSSTISYGPASGNGNADLITQFFLKEVVIRGASLGRGCLTARQQFLQAAGPVLNPTDLKTIGQFLLLGDPSIHPARAPVSAARSVARAAFGEEKADDAARIGRREELSAKGAALPQTLLTAKTRRKSPPSGGPVRRHLLQLAKQANMKRPKITSFRVDGQARPAPGAKAIGALSSPPVVHVMIQSLKAPKKLKTTPVRALIVHQYDSTLVTKQDVFSR